MKKLEPYTDEKVTADTIMSNLLGVMPKREKDDVTDVDRRSYSLGFYDACMQAAIMLGLLDGTETNRQIRAKCRRAKARLDAWMEQK